MRIFRLLIGLNMEDLATMGRIFRCLTGLNMEDLATVRSGAMGPTNLRFVRQAQTEGHKLKDHCTVGPGAPGPMDL